MSRIYDALKKLEAERARRAANGHANGGANGKSNGGTNGGQASAGNGGGGNGNGGNGNGGGGNGKGNGHRKSNGGPRGWRWLFPKRAGNGHGNGHARVGLSLELGPEVEEAYQRLGTNLLVGPMSDAAPAPRLIGLTASRHGEGTTTTAAIFASVLVRRRGGRVVIVEANFRSPSLDTVLGIRRDGGFADVIQGRKLVADVARPTQIPKLFAIGCGHSTLGVPALLDSSGVGPVLDELRAQFDFVVVDLPPGNVYGDTAILAPRLDAALIVIEADRARISEVERLRRNLERVGVKVAGSILNRQRNYIPAFLEEML